MKLSLSDAHVEGPALQAVDRLVALSDVPRLGARQCPEHAALIFAEGRRTTSYRELDGYCDAFAALLNSRGLGPGERIAYLGRNSDLFYPVLIGAIRAQCVLVPINWRLAMPEVRHQLLDSGTRLLVCDPEFEPGVRPLLSELEDLTDLITTERHGGVEGLREQLRAAQPERPESPDLENIAVQLYTSGTTGTPKGVLLSHRSLSLARHMEFAALGFKHLEQGCRILSPMPNFHIGGISWVSMGLIRLGTVVITSDSTPSSLLRLMREYRTAHLFTVASVIRAMVDELLTTQAPRPELTGVFYGAMPMDEKLLRDAMDLFGCAFLQFFGMTEICGSATYLDPSDHDLAKPQKLRSVGKPFPGVSLEIRGPDRRVLKRNEHGEIWINTPTLMQGYWSLPEQTSAAVVDGWYATGDGGYLDDEGFLFLTDRIKDMIVSGGENIYPVEVEAALRRHPAVLDAAVIGETDARWGEKVVAFVQLRPHANVSVEALSSFAREHIAGYKCPKEIRFTDALPRTASGKVQRGRLREPR